MSRYYPDIHEQKAHEAAEKQKQLDNQVKNQIDKLADTFKPKTFMGLMFKPNHILRTDGIKAKEIDNTIHHFKTLANKETDPTKKERYEALMERGESLSDLTDDLYERLKANPESMSNWYPQLKTGQLKTIEQGDNYFKIPKTKIWTLPIELAQYIRVEYSETNNESRKTFNEIIKDVFELDDSKTYFIKTGTFSSKFEFRNTHCTEPAEMGEYFSVINNFAMLVGAGRSVDLVVREWIDDVENRPTIYNGMPLHTEFRSFIDFDSQEIIGTVPYWNPIVMNNVLNTQGQKNPEILKDYQTYQHLVPTLTNDFNNALPNIHQHLEKLIPTINLHGKWSLDIMKNGNDFYLIDMARMEKSALTELLPENQKPTKLKSKDDD